MSRLFRISLLFVLPLMATIYGCDGPKENNDTDNSVFSVSYITSICIEEPQRALALLDTAEQRQLLGQFDISRLRCIVYQNGMNDYKKALRYGLEAYGMPEARGDAGVFLSLVELIADEYYQNGNYQQSVRFCTDGLKVARDSVVRTSEASLDVTLAINMLCMDRDEEAFRLFDEAVDILDTESDRTDTWENTDDYIYALGMTINSLCDAKRYDEAIAYMPRYDEAMARMETKSGIPDGLVGMRRASGYAVFAYMYALKGETGKADEMYDKLCGLPLENDVDDAQLHVPYLLATRRYSEALRYLMWEKPLWQANADTVSREYIDSHLLRELEAYEGLGDKASVIRTLKAILALTDTLSMRERRDKAMELAEIYKTSEQAIEIERQSSSILVRNIVIASVSVLLLCCVFSIVRILRYVRVINTKNKAMVKVIDELMTYKDKVFEQQEELIGLREQLRDLSSAPVPDEECHTDVLEPLQPADAEQNVSEVVLTDFDRMLFDRMHHEILARRLFLNADFSKSTLSVEFNIPRRKFAAIFKEYAGCSFSQYISDCRLDYAVKLMREKPLWNIDAIAKATQMSSSSFYSLFKKKYGMSPSSFKAGNDADAVSTK